MSACLFFAEKVFSGGDCSGDPVYQSGLSTACNQCFEINDTITFYFNKDEVNYHGVRGAEARMGGWLIWTPASFIALNRSQVSGPPSNATMDATFTRSMVVQKQMAEA